MSIHQDEKEVLERDREEKEAQAAAKYSSIATSLATDKGKSPSKDIP